ncbi:apolipoprotein N-acyltransferase [Hydrogenimonas sp.]
MKISMRYFNTLTLSLGFLSALCASLFIYLFHFGLVFPWLQAFLGLLALYGWLTLPRPALFWSGFFTALFWFWWIGLSFRYYDLTWMIPLVIPAVALVYGLLFWLVGLLPHIALRAVALGGLEWLHPMGFDWFRPALLFTNSLFGDALWQLWILLATLTLFALVKRRWRWLLLLGVLGALHIPRGAPAEELPVKLVQTALEQRDKWDPRYRQLIVEANLAAIENARREGYRAVVLPESAFPLYLNRDTDLVERLLARSRDIAIVAGALYEEKGRSYNSTYLFENGTLRVMHKVVLVPFGEEVPLPSWIGRWVNKTFFGGASDYMTAREPSDFTMLGRRWRNAICYEATSDRLYEGDPERMVAISNNAWFLPSVEPALQRLLLQMQANRHGTTIYHATNGPITAVVSPR